MPASTLARDCLHSWPPAPLGRVAKHAAIRKRARSTRRERVKRRGLAGFGVSPKNAFLVDTCSAARRGVVISRRRCLLLQMGLVEYGEAFRYQRAIAAARRINALPDTLMLLQHPPVITLGRRADRRNILLPEESLRRDGIAVWQSTRGGDVTYHGPGQIVGYPILGLRDLGMGASRYVHTLEAVIVDWLTRLGLEARQDPRYVGVWVGDEKIAAIGVAISGGVTTHGFAVNVDPDLSHFQLINPCGITDKGVTSVARLLGRPVAVEEVLPGLLESFCAGFGMEMIPVMPRELAALGISNTEEGRIEGEK